MKPENGFLSRCLLLMALLLLPGSAIAQTPAQQIVDDAAAAMGGRERILAVRTLLLEGEGKEFSFGQGSSWSEMGQEASVWKVIGYRRSFDLTSGRSRFEQSRTPLYAFYAGHVPGKSAQGLDGAVAFNIVTKGEDNAAWLVTGGTLYAVDLKSGKATAAGKLEGVTGRLTDIAWID